MEKNVFWQYWGFNSGPLAFYHLSHSTSPQVSAIQEAM
jgi:hypothetical protein